MGYDVKKILLLGGSAQQVVAIETAKRMGYYTILCDYLSDNPGQYISDKFYQISTTDKEAVLAIALQEQIDGILAYASDPAAPTAAYVAEKLKLPTNPYSAVETLCNKDKFRMFLSSHGFNVPRAKGFMDKEKALLEIGGFNLPIIIKPVDSSGSKGVTVLHGLGGLGRAIDDAFSYSRGHRIIIEEFIERKHPYLIGGDIFVVNGKVIQWGLMNCHRDDRVNRLVPVGKSYPPLLEENNLQSVRHTLQKLVTDLGIRSGPMNVELIVDRHNRVFPIDIGPRSGGNMIPELLSMIFNCDVVKMSVQTVMGEDVGNDIREGHPYFATQNLHSDRKGILNRIDFSPEIQKYIIRKNIYKKPGDYVDFFGNAANALGIIFLRFPDQDTMIKMEENMNAHITIVLRGDK